jgi:hypothetical protein
MSDPTWWNAAPGELYGDSTDVPMCDHCGKYRVFEKGQICGVCILSDDADVTAGVPNR